MGIDISIVEKETGVYLIALKGEINTQTYQALEDKARPTTVKAKAVVFDMAQVNYISSMGLSAIFRIKLAVEEHSGTIALVNMQPKVQLVFDTMKILSPQIFASMEEADDFLDRFLDGVQTGQISPKNLPGKTK